MVVATVFAVVVVAAAARADFVCACYFSLLVFLSLLATSYNWEGTCAEDSSMVCFDADGWTMYGTQCEKKCEGVPTNKQVDKIHQECDEKSRQKFIMGGGHATEWDMSRDNGAAEVRGMLSPLPLHVQFCMCLMFTHIVFLFFYLCGRWVSKPSLLVLTNNLKPRATVGKAPAEKVRPKSVTKVVGKCTAASATAWVW